VDPAADPPLPGLAAGQHADAVPARPPGGDLAAAEAAGRGDPDHDHVVAGIVARLIELPRQSVVLAEDEIHLNLLPHVRASWTLRGARPEVLTPGTNRKITVLGAIELTTGRWVYRLGRRCAADFIALLQMLAETFPAPR
jgi:hypothetical protein